MNPKNPAAEAAKKELLKEAIDKSIAYATSAKSSSQAYTTGLEDGYYRGYIDGANRLPAATPGARVWEAVDVTKELPTPNEPKIVITAGGNLVRARLAEGVWRWGSITDIPVVAWLREVARPEVVVKEMDEGPDGGNYVLASTYNTALKEAVRKEREVLADALDKARLCISRLMQSMLVHPDCTEGSEFDDRTAGAEQILIELQTIIETHAKQ